MDAAALTLLGLESTLHFSFLLLKSRYGLFAQGFAHTLGQPCRVRLYAVSYTHLDVYKRESPNSPKRYRWQGQTDANGKELPPFVDIDKDKMTLTIRTSEGSTEKSRSWELEVVGVLEPDGAKGYWTQSGVVLRIQDMKMLQKVYNDMTKTKTEEKSYEQVYVKVDDLKNVTDVETAIHELGFTCLLYTSRCV